MQVYFANILLTDKIRVQ